MKSALAVLALAASAAAQITLNTPTGALAAIQCSVYQITWSGGTGPFDIRLLDAGQTFLEDITSNANSSPFPWTVNEPAGQQFILSIHDSQGNSGVTAPFTIQPSSNSACLSASPSSAGATSGAASSSAAGSTSGAASTPAETTSRSGAATSAAESTPATAPRPTNTTPSGSTTASRAGASATGASANGAPSLSPSLLGSLVAGLLALAA